MITQVYPIDELLEKAKYVVTVYDRIPPSILMGFGTSEFAKAVQKYRRLMDWKEQGVKYVKLSYPYDFQIDPNMPYGPFYRWVHRLVRSVDLKPVPINPR